MDLLFAFAAGLLTLVNPCILPVLPIALASATAGDRRGPLALAAGMSVAFTVLGVVVASAGPSLGISTESVAAAGAVAMIGFGLVLLVPRFEAAFATATAGLAGAADAGTGRSGQGGLVRLFAGGALLGAVWSPCIGPTLGGAIALASQGQSLGRAAAVMFVFSLGVAVIVLGLAYGTREAIGARSARLRALARISKPLVGAAFIAVGAALLLGLHHVAEGLLLDAMPTWLQDLSVTY